MKRIMIVLAAISIAATSWATDRDKPLPLREANSANRRFQLQIRPGRPGENAVRGCKAGLYEREDGRTRGRPRWERFLVNEVAPGRAFIRDDGLFVITLDEYNRGGARNALVIYGEHGELLRHFLLSDLLDRSAWADVKRDGDSLDWLDGASFQFLESPPIFLITLRHGREIGIDLQRLQAVRQSGALSGVEAVPPNLLEPLFNFSAKPATELADSRRAPERTSQPAAEEPPVALATRTEDAAQPAGDQPDLVDEWEHPPETPLPPTATQSPQEKAKEMPLEEMAPKEVAADASEDDYPPLDEPDVAADRAPADAGLKSVPRPDPAAPVDYLAWANSLIGTDGPSAVAEYQAAVDCMTRWAGDRDLLKAAQAGDPAALASPEIQAWLAANQEALARFRNGLGLEYGGWPVTSPDGSLILAMLPALQAVRELSGASVIEGRQYEAAGLASSAAASYFDALSAGASAGSGPTLIETIIGSSMQNTAANAILDLEASQAGRQLDYTALGVLLDEDYRPPRPLAETVQFERATFMDAIQRMYTYDAQTDQYSVDSAKTAEYLSLFGELISPDRAAAVTSQLAERGFERTLADGDEYYQTIADALTRPYAEAQQMLERYEGRLDSQIANPLPGGFSYYRYHQVRTKVDALQRATRLVTQLNAYRQENGEYPDSLDVFGSADFAVDPFTGAALRYERNGQNFRLYSVGLNGADDGGVDDPSGEAGDIVYWPRPAPPPPAAR